MKIPALALSLILALQPGIAGAAQVITTVRTVTPVGSVSAAAGAALRPLALTAGANQTYNPTLGSTLFSPTAISVQPALMKESATPQAVSAAAKFTLPTAQVRKQTSFAKKVGGIVQSVAGSVQALTHAGTSDARTGAAKQIDILTGVRSGETDSAVEVAPSAGPISSPLARLKKASLNALDEAPPQKTKSAIGKWIELKTEIFREKERNRSFWRMFLGEAIYLFGFQMYIVALPFLMKSFTKNSLNDNGQLRDATAEALNAMVRENRSLARIAHWVAQAVAYIAIPLFTKDGSGGPKKWLFRSAMGRMAVLFGVPVVFFATGLLSVQAALWTLLGLIATQSFFQGVYVIMMSGATARLMGHKSVLPSERMRANSMRTFLSALVAIIAPFIAGQIAGMPEWFGKAGTGSALIYGIYAASVGLAGLIFASIRMFGAKTLEEMSEDGETRMGTQAVAVKGLWGAVKNAGVSMIKGVKQVWANKFLRTLMIIGLISSLFADPLVFNVLPEFVEGVLAANPGALDAILGLPLIGWFFKGLITTPMGFFALLITSSSVGSALASLMLNPLRKLFMKLGFTTEERLTIPFYVLAFLQVPAFWLMINSGSIVGLLALYGLQTFLGGFVGMVMTGIYQKKIRNYSDLQMNQVLAANSFVGIIAAIAATLLYGFVLNGIPIATSLWIAGIATTILGLIQLVSPWLLFDKTERGKNNLQPHFIPGAHPRDVHTPHGHEHLPNTTTQGPMNIGL